MPMDVYSQRQRLQSIRKKIDMLRAAFDLDGLRAELRALSEKANADDFWSDAKKAQDANRRISHCEKRIRQIEGLDAERAEASELLGIIEELGDETEFAALSKDISALDEKTDALSNEALLTGKYDANNAILTLHAGAGGTEAQDWVEMLYRMYARYCERNGFSIRPIDRLNGDDAGIKSVTFLVEGENAYGYLHPEMGVHRLVRISPFDAGKRRHTSFASLEVIPELDDDCDVAISPDDIKVDTYRSGGAGGQHVNKTDSAVRITHLPTGIVVQCQNERSQIQNRETAMKMLAGKLAELREREQIEKSNELKGELKKIEWGSQIRSYVFCPYTLVKDHRTGWENANIADVMDGKIQDFVIAYLTAKNRSAPSDS